MKHRWAPHLPVVIVGLCLAGMLSLEIGTAWQESQTVDEAVHLAAGFSYWKTGDFRLNPEHPPLIKELAAIPLLFTKATFPITDPTWSAWAQYPLGSVFLYQNTLSPQTILFLGRLPIMLLSLVLGWLIFRTSRRMFGDWGGVVSVALYSLEPGFIAHSGLVTTDLGMTLFSFIVTLRFVTLIEQPNRRNVLWFAVVLWLAWMSKFSMIAFTGCLVVIALALKLRIRHHPALQIKRWLKYGLVALPFALLITWTFYHFDIRRRADDPHVAELYRDRITYLQQNDLSKKTPLVRFVMNVVGNDNTAIGAWVYRTGTIRIPGYAFFRGAIAVIGHSIGGQSAFLHGEFRDTGWWYFFPTAIAVKTSLPTLFAGCGLATIVIIWVIRRRRNGWSWIRVYRESDLRWWVFLVVPACFLIISMGSHLNLGWRHIMPVYPYIFVLAGVFASPTIFPAKRWRIFVPTALVLGSLITQIRTFPNELGYFNSLAGGSANGSRWLLDSNLDWGQDLPKLATYMRQHHLASVPFAYYGWAKVSAFVTTTPLPKQADLDQGAAQPHGVIAISIGQRIAPDHRYDWLGAYQPIATVGSSILIYHLP